MMDPPFCRDSRSFWFESCGKGYILHGCMSIIIGQSWLVSTFYMMDSAFWRGLHLYHETCQAV